MGLGDDTDGRWRGVGRLYFWPFRFLLKPANAGERVPPGLQQP
jgi:hypothetical protein